jgi:uncharacterized protein GlcG (DUF336 family)
MRSYIKWFAGIAVLGWILPTAALAADLPQIKTLPLELAIQAGKATLKQCEQDGYRISVTVVNPSGVRIAVLRHDGAGPHTLDSSFKKAYTAASMGRPTLELTELLTKMPRIEGLRDMNDNILILGGGLPIRFAGQLVGGIGVGGAPGDKLDENCARAGLKAIGAE